MGVTSFRFAAAARDLCTEARRLGLVAPGFRSPPRLPDADRSLRRRSGAAPAVAVRLRGRTESQVLGDMVEGVLAVNGLTGSDAQHHRPLLRRAVGLGHKADEAGCARAPGTAA